jgi:hypothetical protein
MKIHHGFISNGDHVLSPLIMEDFLYNGTSDQYKTQLSNTTYSEIGSNDHQITNY